MTSESTPAGWYDDGQGAVRWWDGVRWTDHTQQRATKGLGAFSSATSAASSYAQNLLQRHNPASDTDAIWTAVGKPVTGIGGGRYRLTEEYLYFEKGTLSTKAQQILVHEIHDVDATQTMTQKARGVGTIVLFTVRSGSGTRERVELVDIDNFREGVAALNRVSHQARGRLRTQLQTQHVNYTGVPTTGSTPGQATSASVTGSAADLNAELAKLVAFKEQGVLDDEEFAAAKRKLLGL